MRKGFIYMTYLVGYLQKYDSYKKILKCTFRHIPSLTAHQSIQSTVLQYTCLIVPKITQKNTNKNIIKLVIVHVDKKMQLTLWIERLK